MSVSLKACTLLLVISTAMCAVPQFDRYSVANNNLDLLDSNDLVPPQDPAVNTLPKEPVVPLVPTCVHSGYFRDPFNCGKFYYCVDGQAGPIAFYCRQGLIFNELNDVCDNPNFVDC